MVHDNNILGEHDNNILGEHVGSPLHAVVQWFKTMTTNAYIRGVNTFGWQRFEKKLWQRDYWEHIIRNDYAYQRIANYIVNNPVAWEKDKFNTA
jgi:REP element-mobilizing transposase RayT